jgi:ribonucleoside-diphosphate reductase alpha chain
LARLAEEVAKRLSQVSKAGGGGIAPEAQTWQSSQAGASAVPELKDRGVFHHAADAMRGMYEMGDAPSCSTCGAIMVRNGSCYRCMSCGSTSGCS